MDSPRGRPGRTPGSVKPTAAALAVALMGMGGVALAAPKADQSAPEQGNEPAPQAQANGAAPPGNGLPAQAQDSGPAPQANGPAPQAQDAAPPPQAKAKGHQGAGKPAGAPPAPPAQGGDNPAPGGGQAGPRYHGRPAPGETRGQGRGRGKCQSAACRGAVPKPDAGASGDGQPPPAAGQQDPAGDAAPGGSKGRPYGDRPANDPGDDQSGGADQLGGAEIGSVLGANQGGGEAVEADPSSFDTALPFTGSEVLLLAGIGALLWLAGMRLRRSTA